MDLRSRRVRPVTAAYAVAVAVVLPGVAIAAAPTPPAVPGCGGPTATTVPPGHLTLPSPERPDLLTGVTLGVQPDRLLCSHVPGLVSNTERVMVGLSGSGIPVVAKVEQRLTLRGTGNYVIRERGPARQVVPLDDTVAPILQRGTVVWQGFVPARRDLAALLTLDAGLEVARLPIAASLTFTPAGGPSGVPLGDGGVIPGPGTVTIRLTNQTTLPNQQLTAGTGGAVQVAAALSVLLEAAQHPGPRPPIAGHDGLPTSVPVDGQLGARFADVTVPLRVVGTVRMTGATGTVHASGPGTTPLPDGVRVAGTLSKDVSLAFDAPSSGTLVIDLTAVPTLDPRTLQPPAPARTWSAWAAANPSSDSRSAATDQLVAATATAAALTTYAPYLAAGVDGPVTTSFHLALAPVQRPTVAKTPLSPRPIPIGLAALALLLVLGGVQVLRLRL